MFSFLQEVQKMVAATCKRLCIHPYEVTYADGRKNMMLLKLTAKKCVIMEAVYQASDGDAFITKKTYDIINSLFRDDIRELLERYFKGKIADMIFFPRVTNNGTETLYISVIWANSIFKQYKKEGVDIERIAYQESVLMRRFTETLKGISARRAKSTRVYLFMDEFVVYFFDSFYTEWEHEFVFSARNKDKRLSELYEDLMEQVLTAAVLQMRKAYCKGVKPTSVYDFKLNKGMVLLPCSNMRCFEESVN